MTVNLNFNDLRLHCVHLRARSETVYLVVWYTDTSLVDLKSYRHFFLADCHTGMPYTKFGQLIVKKIIKIVAYICVS